MRKNKRDLTGIRFGKLVALEIAPSDKYPNGRTVGKWKCKCDCGNVVEVRTDALLQKRQKTCGCGRKGIRVPLVEETCPLCGKKYTRRAYSRTTQLYCKECQEEGKRRDAAILNNMNPSGVKRLIEAVITRAREDYVNGEIGQRRNPDNVTAGRMHDEAELFFKSEWFLKLTMLEDINYNWLFKALDREVDMRWNNGQITDDADDFVGDDWE